MKSFEDRATSAEQRLTALESKLANGTVCNIRLQFGKINHFFYGRERWQTITLN
jgi:hypothetical protein